MRLRGPLAVIAVSALVAAGCGRDMDKAKVATDAKVATPEATLSSEQESAVRTSGTLTADGGAASVVMTLVRDVADGGGPALLPAYDPRIPERIGFEKMVGALQTEANLIAGTRPAVTRTHKTRSGRLVSLRLLRTEGDDSKHSFLLRRQDRRWTIVYDSLLAQAVQSYVVGQKSRDPSNPSAEAIKAGQRAASELGLAVLGRSSGDSPRERPPASPSDSTSTQPAVPTTSGNGVDSP